jgi:hypothetical protein
MSTTTGQDSLVESLVGDLSSIRAPRGRPARHDVRVGDQHARRALAGPTQAHGLAALHQQRFVALELEQRAQNRTQRLRIARGLAGTVVDDQLLGLLRDLGVRASRSLAGVADQDAPAAIAFGCSAEVLTPTRVSGRR